jgi:hypothetical protein
LEDSSRWGEEEMVVVIGCEEEEMGVRYNETNKMKWQHCKMREERGVAGYTLKEYSMPHKMTTLRILGSLVCQRR